MIPYDLTEEAPRRVFWPKITLIGSLRFYREMLDLYEQFSEEEIDALVSWPFFRDFDNVRKFDVRADQESCEKFSVEAHLLRIKSSDAVYVVNPDGYAGLNTATDIGYAVGQEKRVYAMRPVRDTGVNALIDGVKTPKGIILIGKQLEESKYKALRQKLTSK